MCLSIPYHDPESCLLFVSPFHQIVQRRRAAGAVHALKTLQMFPCSRPALQLKRI